MWPLDLRPSNLVRIGHHAVEHWRRTRAGWHLGGRQAVALDTASADHPLVPALQGLWAEGRPDRPIDVVIESRWAPVLLIAPGEHLIDPQDVAALFRLRLTTLHGSEAEPTESWTVRCVHRPGDTHALGYGLPPDVMAALQLAASTLGVRWRALHPTLDWALQHSGRRRAAQPHWILCPEQDRALLAFFDHRRLVALHAAVDLPSGPNELAELIARESARHGLPAASAPVATAHWRDGERLLDWTWSTAEQQDRRRTASTAGPAAVPVQP